MNRFIQADAQKCIGCRTCEVACVMAHQDASGAPVSARTFTPRIRIIKGSAVSTAVACHHCEDAPCVGVCPTAALVIAHDAVQIREANCIGCKGCMLACPFGAIDIVALPGDATAVKVVKCDLCQHRSAGPACVAACPTGALRCLDGRTLREAAADKRRRAALCDFA